MARIGHGTKLIDKGTAGSGNTEIGGLEDINIGGISLATIDSTAMDAVDRYRKFIAGLRDGGEITYTVNSDPVASGSSLNWHAIKDAYEDNTPHVFDIVLPNGTKFGYSALTTNIAIPTPLAEKVVTNVTQKITGKPTWTNA